MPSEVIRCTDCGAVFKGVPSWLIGAKVKFTCTNCPKRPNRGVARFEPPTPVVAILDPESEADLDAVAMDDPEDDADLELAAEDLDDIKDEKEL